MKWWVFVLIKSEWFWNMLERWRSLWCMKCYAFFSLFCSNASKHLIILIFLLKIYGRNHKNQRQLCVGRLKWNKIFDTEITVKWPFNSSRIHVCAIQYYFLMFRFFFASNMHFFPSIIPPKKLFGPYLGIIKYLHLFDQGN